MISSGRTEVTAPMRDAADHLRKLERAAEQHSREAHDVRAQEWWAGYAVGLGHAVRSLKNRAGRLRSKKRKSR